MSDSVEIKQDISSQLPIDQLLAQVDAMEDVVFLEKHAGKEIAFRVRPIDLEKMHRMGLGHLPIDAIAVPATSPLLRQTTIAIRNSLNIGKQLTQFFPSRFVAALYEIQSLVNRGDFPVSVIGGVSRDLMIAKERRHEIKDVDLTVEGDAIACARFIVEHSRNFKLDKEYEAFGTGKLIYKDDVHFDIASTRKEIYHACGALPEIIEQGVSLAEDSLRRDFTINALAMSINELGQILDYTHGIEDIHGQQIRVLHPLSFFEDPTRILRAFKFLTRLDFELSFGTRRLLEKFLEYGEACYKGGGERVKYELKAFLSLPESPAKRKWLDYFFQHSCFRLVNMTEPYLFSERLLKKLLKISNLLPLCWEEVIKIDADLNIEELTWRVYLCFLLEESSDDIWPRIGYRLGLTREEKEVIEVFRMLQRQRALKIIHEQATPGDIYELFHQRPMAAIIAVIIESSFEKPGLLNVYFEALLRYKQKLENVQLELNGKDILDLGVPPGSEVGHILRQMLHAKLSRRLPDRISEIQFAKKLIQQRHPQPVPEEES